MIMASQFVDMMSSSKFLDAAVFFFFFFFVKFSYLYKFNVNIITSSAVMTIFAYKRLTKN